MKIFFRGAIGVALGGALLWVALYQFDWREASVAVARANLRLMLGSIGIYWINLGVRMVRWQLLLSRSKKLSYAQVGQVLIAGYAVNNLLPARLGELFRADYLRRLYGVQRSAALGSIILERLLDGMTVVTLFGIGSATAGLQDGNSVLISIAATSAARYSSRDL